MRGMHVSNPLVAAPVDSTTAVSGAPILESAMGVKDSIESGDWASAVLGVAGTAMDALGAVADPFGTILAAGVGWLMEHVGPLKEALDALAGNPDAVAAHSQTWTNVAQELDSISTDLTGQVTTDVAGWTGPGADAYRRQAADVAALLGAAGAACQGAASGVSTAGEVVASVRELVRDTIAEVVARLVSWAIQVIATLGIGLTWVVPQVVALVAKTSTRIASLVKNLTGALKKLSELLGKAGKVFGDASGQLKKIKASGPVDSSTKPNSLEGTRGLGDPGPSRPRPPQEEPFAPNQPAYGSSGIPGNTHDHVIYGDVKVPKKGKPKFSGGHVWHGDIPSAPGGTHGSGVTGSSTSTISPPRPNGVYDVHKPTTTNSSGGTVVKPGMSSMFPQGLGPSQVQGLANQAWNGGAPNGGFHGTNSWSGQAQIPYTPVWNPAGDAGLPAHGSGSGNHPNAGSILNIGGYHNGGSASTYYPDGNNTTPPVQPPQDPFTQADMKP
ncbi:hypothetical protein HFP15_28910 [Amycolatopsis sp. K13G38]|uniref:WXG100 family type VII secretion target n=1 Tax=Amycolatopsis acididurans TaxID=2724524 RepID=A0ABX1JDY6_9PSEU|nr:hypothetical protein [Amycolatopsis acididurans]NKQ56900.1 hypothetical protein [Amycolatopsis acididurans]